MSNKQTSLHAVNDQGQHFSLQHTTTDSPLLPAANLEHLKQIDPSLVSFVVEQTKLEADARRKANVRVNWFIFLERIAGVLMGGIVAIIGFVIAAYVILQGHDWAGVGLCGATLTTIVTVLVTKQRMTKKADGDGDVKKPRPRVKKVQ